jgi:hypothetical protein
MAKRAAYWLLHCQKLEMNLARARLSDMGPVAFIPYFRILFTAWGSLSPGLSIPHPRPFKGRGGGGAVGAAA